MAKPKQTGQKREKELKKKSRQKEKEERKLERKNDSNKGKGFESMMAYVDEFGRISDTPPDPNAKKKEMKLEDIQLGARKPDPEDAKEFLNEGRVTYYNEEKGFGFIKDSRTSESVFFSIRELKAPLKLNELVSFVKERGVKGMNARDIRKV